MKRGFTLIELSIVLVIIGLIVGGVLTGQQLIAASKVRATITQYNKFNTAVNTFRVKYNAFPGDIAQSEAVTHGLLPVSRPGITNVTHGNGFMESGAAMGSFTTAIASESLLFWQDLSSAQLIEYKFTSATDAAVAISSTGLTNYFPTSPLDKTYWVANGNTISTVLSPAAGVNLFYLGGITSINASGVATLTSPITPNIAYNIDAKIDDGLPEAGFIRSNYAGLLFANYPGSEGSCSVLDQYSPTGRTTYDIVSSRYANQPECAISLKIQ